MAFVDKCKIYVKAGDGGNGIVAWRREAHVPLGGPAGGNGGNGASIFFIADRNETSLEHLKYKKHIVAENGINGDIKNMHGANATDIYIKVPIGTVVYNDDTNQIICDFITDKQTHLIAKGGYGGHGNAYFKSSFNKAPSLYENGDIGEAFNLKLELKEIADIGIIGFPNTGKSSLISKITNAKPKIANYMFTTLVPILGVLNYHDEKIVICDIPGIIENASSGIGLGFEFLKHIERCKVLIHLISLDKEDNMDIIKSYQIINEELKKYNLSLFDKKIILVANKNDVPEADKQLKILEEFLKTKILAISCLNDINLDKLKDLIIKAYLETKQEIIKQEIEIYQYNNQNEKTNLDETLEINQLDECLWEVKSEYLKYWSHKIPLTTQDNIIRYNQKISKLNLESALLAKGAHPNDTLLIYGTEVVLDGNKKD